MPPEILDKHKNIVMGIDIMFINGIPFQISISRIITFGSATEMEGTNMDNVTSVLKTIVATYESLGFNVLAIAVDGGFQALKTHTEFLELNIVLNLCSKDEHEPHIERFDRTIKEMTQMGLAGVPFTKLPKRMVVELVYAMVFWFNFTTPDDYISNTLGPASIVLGQTYAYNVICGTGTWGVRTSTREDNTYHEDKDGQRNMHTSHREHPGVVLLL